jgi:hypothetical protein
MTKGRKNSYCVARSSGSRDPRQLQMRRRVAARPSSGSRQTASSPDSLRVGAPRPNYLLLVPSVVDRAAPSGVVPGELGGAAVLGARSGFAEGSYHRSGARGAASAIASQHNHARIVPPPQGKLCWASPTRRSARCGRVGSVDPAGSSSRVVLDAVVGLAGRCRRLGSTGPARGRLLGRAALARPAQIGGPVAGCRGPASRRAARPSIRDRELAWR